MTLPGETTGARKGDGVVCGDGCEQVLYPEVCRSAAGYYVGLWCPECGPYSRESGYFATKEEAEKELANDSYFRL